MIDSDYRGTVFVLLFNFSDQDFESKASHAVFFSEVLITLFLVQEGDRIAQLIIEKIETPDVVEVNVSTLLSRVFGLTVDLYPSYVGPQRDAPRCRRVRLDWRSYRTLNCSRTSLYVYLDAISLLSM